MTFTADKLLELARAASKWDGIQTNPGSDAEIAWLRYREATRNPARIIALAEALRDYDTTMGMAMQTDLDASNTPKAK